MPRFFRYLGTAILFSQYAGLSNLELLNAPCYPISLLAFSNILGNPSAVSNILDNPLAVSNILGNPLASSIRMFSLYNQPRQPHEDFIELVALPMA